MIEENLSSLLEKKCFYAIEDYITNIEQLHNALCSSLKRKDEDTTERLINAMSKNKIKIDTNYTCCTTYILNNRTKNIILEPKLTSIKDMAEFSLRYNPYELIIQGLTKEETTEKWKELINVDNYANCFEQ